MPLSFWQAVSAVHLGSKKLWSSPVLRSGAPLGNSADAFGEQASSQGASSLTLGAAADGYKNPAKISTLRGSTRSLENDPDSS